MTTPRGEGPLSWQDLEALWVGATDPGYVQKIREGGAYEAYLQMFRQLARVSLAVDRTFESNFLLPWSGQTDEPASGAAFSHVELTFARTKRLAEPLILAAGHVFVEEETDDAGPLGRSPVLTGRRYVLEADVVFLPGEAGPLVVEARAERPGRGYDNPLPGALKVVSQPGAGFTNDRARLAYTNPGILLRDASEGLVLLADNQPDVPIPEHRGQYVVLGGTNALRVFDYGPPNLLLSPPSGGAFTLARHQVFFSTMGAAFVVGEEVELKTSLAVTSGWARVERVRDDGGGATTTALLLKNGSAPLGGSATGMQSGESGAVDRLVWLDQAAADAATSWRVLDWVEDFGLTVSNALSPSGGRLDILDTVGAERRIPRASSEGDDPYRLRVAEVADLVCPNAIRRALYKTLPGVGWEFWEAGQETFPGFYFDLDAWDLDFLILAGIDSMTGAFLDGEPVEQVSSAGIISIGRMVVALTPPPILPGLPLAATPIGLTRARGAFDTHSDVVGKWSGARLRPGGWEGGLRPGDEKRLLLDYEQMRAFFFVALPDPDPGQSGFAWGDHPRAAFDAAPFDDFYDEVAPTAKDYLLAYQTVDRIRAKGVGWEVVRLADFVFLPPLAFMVDAISMTDFIGGSSSFDVVLTESIAPNTAAFMEGVSSLTPTFFNDDDQPPDVVLSITLGYDSAPNVTVLFHCGHQEFNQTMPACAATINAYMGFEFATVTGEGNMLFTSPTTGEGSEVRILGQTGNGDIISTFGLRFYFPFPYSAPYSFPAVVNGTGTNAGYTDAVRANLMAERVPNDSLSISDALTFFFDRTGLADSISVSDSLEFFLDVFLSDTVSVSDTKSFVYDRGGDARALTSSTHGPLSTTTFFTTQNITLGYDAVSNFSVQFLASDSTIPLCVARINAAAGFTFCFVDGDYMFFRGIATDSTAQVRIVSDNDVHPAFPTFALNAGTTFLGQGVAEVTDKVSIAVTKGLVDTLSVADTVDTLKT